MASPLVSDIVTMLQDRFPDLTTARGVSFVNFVHREVCALIPSITRKVQNINITDDVGTYALDANTTSVSRATFNNAAGTKSDLQYLDDRDKLFESDPLWQYTVKSTPTMYFLTASVDAGVNSIIDITLYPRPTGTTAAGAPLLTLQTTVVQTLISSSELPEGLTNYSAYLEGASYYAAAALRGPAEAQAYMPTYQAWLKFTADTWLKKEPRNAFDSTFPYRK